MKCRQNKYRAKTAKSAKKNISFASLRVRRATFPE